MAGFSHINLLSLEDTVAGRVDGIEGRFGRKQLASRDLGVSLWRYAPGFKAVSGHRHRVQEEAYVVVAGSGRPTSSGPARTEARLSRPCARRALPIEPHDQRCCQRASGQHAKRA